MDEGKLRQEDGECSFENSKFCLEGCDLRMGNQDFGIL